MSYEIDAKRLTSFGKVIHKKYLDYINGLESMIFRDLNTNTKLQVYLRMINTNNENKYNPFYIVPIAVTYKDGSSLFANLRYDTGRHAFIDFIDGCLGNSSFKKIINDPKYDAEKMLHFKESVDTIFTKLLLDDLVEIIYQDSETGEVKSNRTNRKKIL